MFIELCVVSLCVAEMSLLDVFFLDAFNPFRGKKDYFSFNCKQKHIYSESSFSKTICQMNIFTFWTMTNNSAICIYFILMHFSTI